MSGQNCVRSRFRGWHLDLDLEVAKQPVDHARPDLEHEVVALGPRRVGLDQAGGRLPAVEPQPGRLVDAAHAEAGVGGKSGAAHD